MIDSTSLSRSFPSAMARMTVSRSGTVPTGLLFLQIAWKSNIERMLIISRTSYHHHRLACTHATFAFHMREHPKYSGRLPRLRLFLRSLLTDSQDADQLAVGRRRRWYPVSFLFLQLLNDLFRIAVGAKCPRTGIHCFCCPRQWACVPGVSFNNPHHDVAVVQHHADVGSPPPILDLLHAIAQQTGLHVCLDVLFPSRLRRIGAFRFQIRPRDPVLFPRRIAIYLLKSHTLQLSPRCSRA